MNIRAVAVTVAIACAGCGHKKGDHPPARAASSPSPSATAPAGGDSAVAIAFIGHLLAGEYAAARGLYDPAVLDKVTVDDVAAVGKSITMPGKPDSMIATPSPNAPSHVIIVDARFTSGALYREIVLLRHGHVVGIVAKPGYQAPGYVDAEAYADRPIVVGTGNHALPGLLSLPKGAGPFPVVILLQGSGPSDLDEYGGDPAQMNIMPFRDLADGIASRGVAVVRFDKATFGADFLARGIAVDQLTVKDEYFDPLADALALVAKTPELDGKRVFLLGHSMAGWLLPWMLTSHPEIKGGILASGNARHFADLPIEQDPYLYKLQAPGITADQLALLKAMDEQKAKLAKDPNLDEQTPPSQLPYGAPAHSWRAIATYDALAIAAKVAQPMLLLQGGRDYNVTMVDHELWKKAFAGNHDVTAKAYPDLNHDYETGTGTATPTELLGHGHVAQPVVEDIAAWIKAH